MIRSIYRFHFDKQVPMEEVEKALALSTIAVEALYGQAQMKVDGIFSVDRKGRTCTIDRETDLGCDLAKVMTGFLRIHVDDEDYEVEQTEIRDAFGDSFNPLKVFFG